MVSPTLIRFVIYALFGVGLEMLFTGIKQSLKNKNFTLTGESHGWMFPIYGLGGLFFEFIHGVYAPYNWFLRGLIYTVLIYIIEYASGWAIRKTTGRCPWVYDNKWNVHGLIRLDFVFIWFFLGLVFESLHLFLLGHII